MQLKCARNSICHWSFKKVLELTGSLDDMTAEVSAGMPTAAAPFFHRSLLAQLKSCTWQHCNSRLSPRKGFIFVLLPKEALKSVPWAEFHIFAIIFSDWCDIKCVLFFYSLKICEANIQCSIRFLNRMIYSIQSHIKHQTSTFSAFLFPITKLHVFLTNTDSNFPLFHPFLAIECVNEGFVWGYTWGDF